MSFRHYLTLATILVAATFLAAQSAPVPTYDYHIPDNTISPITLGMGGINLTNSSDYFTSYDNPALLANNTGTAFAASFRLKNDKNLTLADVTDARNLLKPKTFMYYTLITKSAAWTYQPVTSTHVSEIEIVNNVRYRRYFDYQLDKLQLSLAAKDEKYNSLAGGLSVKYLTGRLVKLDEKFVGNNSTVTVAPLIDDKVKGLSTDLGLTYGSDKYIWGLCIYDLYSRLWWENFDAKSLSRRGALGFEYNTTGLSLMATAEGKMSKYPETIYHFGLVKDFNWGGNSTNPTLSNTSETSKASQNLIIRAGIFSHDFNGTDNINFTLGSGYNYNMFRVDFALTNTGFMLNNSEYLFSVGVGIQ